MKIVIFYCVIISWLMISVLITRKFVIIMLFGNEIDLRNVFSPLLQDKRRSASIYKMSGYVNAIHLMSPLQWNNMF